MNIITGNRQTVFDIAIQCCGSVEAAFDIAALNDIGVTSCPAAGSVVTVPDMINKKVADYFGRNGIRPATGFRQDMTVPVPDGMEGLDGDYYWGEICNPGAGDDGDYHWEPI